MAKQKGKSTRITKRLNSQHDKINGLREELVSKEVFINQAANRLGYTSKRKP